MNVLREERGSIVVLTLQDDATRNALARETVSDLRRHVADCAAEGRVLMEIRHDGPAFSSGFERKSDPGEQLLRRRFVEIQQLFDELLASPFVTVAYADGAAVGAGADLFTHCDIRLTGRRASFRFPGARFGVVLGVSRLSGVVGSSVALQLVLGQRTIDAEVAELVGLSRNVADEDVVRAEMSVLAESLGELGQPAVGRVLSALRAPSDPKGGGSPMDHLVASFEPSGLSERMSRGLGRLARPGGPADPIGRNVFADSHSVRRSQEGLVEHE